MKRLHTILATILFFLFSFTCFAQNYIGDWSATLVAGAQSIPMVLHIIKDQTQYKATLDIPSQGAKEIPLDEVNVSSDSLSWQIKVSNILYLSKFNKDSQYFDGEYRQDGFNGPLIFRKAKITESVLKRPQTPQPPFPYSIENITIPNTVSGITLGATLTKPKTNKSQYACIVLVTGSGPQNRDEELFGHKPFSVLADFLTRNGYAVLRYDDRGKGQTTGNYSTATIDSFTTDAVVAIQYLKTRKDIGKIGLYGHSEGGQIVTKVTAENPNDVAFMVMQAGPGLRGDSLMLLQEKAMVASQNLPEKDLVDYLSAMRQLHQYAVQNPNRQNGLEKMKLYIDSSIKAGDSNISEEQLKIAEKSLLYFYTSENYSFVRFDPKNYLEKIKVPILAMNGSKDIQVLPTENLNAIQIATVHNKQVKTIEIPGLNHLFQECNTCTVPEYSELEQTYSPKALSILLDWLKETVN